LRSLPAGPPSLAVRLADDVTLTVQYNSPDQFDFEPTISAPAIDRVYQVKLNQQLKERHGALSTANCGKGGIALTCAVAEARLNVRLTALGVAVLRRLPAARHCEHPP